MAGTSASVSSSDGRRRRLLKALVPWVGTTGLMLWLIQSHDMGAVWRALTEADLGGLTALWLAAIGITFVMDSFGLWLAFSWLNGAVEFWRLLRVKGISYFLNIVNYAAASGGIAWMVSRRAEFPLSEAASSALFLNVVDLLVLNVLVSVGLLLEGNSGSDLTLLSATARQTLFYINVGIYGLYFGSMAYWNLGLDFLVLGPLRRWRIFTAFSRASLRIHAFLFIVRLGLLLVYIAMQFLVVHLFGIDAPLGAVMVINTVVTLVQTIPISVAGFGTVQFAMLELYAPYGSEAAILAYSTASLIVFLLVRAAIGYVCLLFDKR